MENGFVDTIIHAFFGNYVFNGFIGGGIDRFKAFLDFSLDGFGDNLVFEVVDLLFLSSGVTFGEHTLHGVGDFIGIENNATFDVPCGASGCLNEGAFGAQKSFFISI